MPLYQFYCKKCEKTFEVFLRISESRQGSVCPYCNGNETERSLETEGKENRDTLTPGVCGMKKDS
jgi:putative FmdB family regulatory protein